MADSRSSQERFAVVGSVFGAELRLESDTEIGVEIIRECLPPGWQEGVAGTTPLELSVTAAQDGSFEVRRAGSTAAWGQREDVVEQLDHIVRSHVVVAAPNHVFVHAGVVAQSGCTIVIPGQSFSGKTTLVAELVRAGALYYSDEYAVLDASGLVHAYPKPLSVRALDGTLDRVNHDPASFGATVGTEPAPIGLVVSTQYRTTAAWQPSELGPAETVLELMKHTFSTLDRPEQTLAVLGRAAAGATTLKGDRGDAGPVAADLLARIKRTAAS